MRALAALLVIGMAMPAMPAMAAQEGDSGKERLICKRDYATQTRLGAGRKVCRTAEEWRGKAAPAAAATPKPTPEKKVRTQTAFAPAPAPAPAPASMPAPAETAALVQVASSTPVTITDPKKEKKVCRRQESSTSRLGAGPKICMTVAEWRHRDGLPAEDDSEKLLMHQGKGR